MFYALNDDDTNARIIPLQDKANLDIITTGNASITVNWGNIEGNIKNQKDLIDYLTQQVSTLLDYKGTVATYTDLEKIKNAKVGDTYNVTDEGGNYAWSGKEWDKLSDTVDLSGYYTKEDVNGKFALYTTTEALNTTLTAYATTEAMNQAIAGVTVPTKVSQLTNDSNFVTETALEAKNYLTEHQPLTGYLKTETADEKYVAKEAGTTLVTDKNIVTQLSAVAEASDNLLTGTATTITDVATDATTEQVVTALNGLITALKGRGIIK